MRSKLRAAHLKRLSKTNRQEDCHAPSHDKPIYFMVLGRTKNDCRRDT